MRVTRRRTNPDGSTGEQVFDTEARGLACPKCGCRHFYTIKTRHVADHVRRVKICRNCGWRGKSVERLMGA